MSNDCALSGASNSEIPEILWRYVKPSWINKKGELLPVCFNLRPERSPPETFVSMHEGVGANLPARMKSAVDYLKEKGWDLAPTGKILSLDTQDACDVVNTPNKIIGFVDKDRPHFGLCYLVDRDDLILEAKTLLAEESDLHDYSHLVAPKGIK